MMIVLLLGIFLTVTALFNRPSWLFYLLALLSYAYYFQILNDGLSVFLIFILGIILLVLELYMPTLGLLGLAGAYLAGSGIFDQSQTFEEAAYTLIAACLLGILTALLNLKLGKTPIASQHLVLSTALNREGGYSSQKEDWSQLLGAKGIVEKDLRPVGRARIQGHRVEVIGEDDFISAGETIEVIKVSGSKVFVRKEGNMNE